MKSQHGYYPGAVMLRSQIKEMRDHVEYEKFLCRMIKDDKTTQQFKKNTLDHPNSLHQLNYCGEVVEKFTAAGKKK